ncbi:MAG: G8 domain-containing protein [Meiothermus sp.]|nr:G8 domain-containing protein [Meiothermus sp.]
MLRFAALLLLLLLGACNLNSAPAPEPLPGTLWTDPQSWTDGTVPESGAEVTVAAGKTVVLNRDVKLKSLTIYGTLVFGRQDLELSADWIMIHGPGKLQIGSPERPFTHKATITLTDNDRGRSVMGMGGKFLGAMMGAGIEIHGEDRVDWTKLAATAPRLTTQIRLADRVDWRAGERVVIASTALDPSEAEEREVVGVSSDGRTVTLDRPLDYLHYGELQSFGGMTLDSRAEVGLLSRNVVIQGDNRTGTWGGHLMVMGSDPGQRETNPAMRSSARIRGVEFRYMGQRNVLGRYPVHWHRNGESAGDFVEGSSFHSNFQRGVVVHGTDGVRVADNVVFASVGHSFMTEDGSERGNSFERNLGLATTPFDSVPPNPVQASQNDTQAATFWLKGGSNRFVGNAAAGGAHSGFWFDNVGPVDPSVFEFRDNTVHSYQAGRIPGERLGGKGAIWVTGPVGSGDEALHPVHGPFRFENTTVYKNREGYWANSTDEPTGEAKVDIVGAILADNVLGTSSHGLRDSVVVGRSANPDSDPMIGSSGIQEYRATTYLTNVQFFNFAPTSTALDTRNCVREGGDMQVRGVQMNGSPFRLCSGGNNDMAIYDLDGSLTGAVSTTVPATSRFMFDEACPLQPNGTRRCPGLIEYAALSLETDLFYQNLRPALPSAPMPSLTRSDGLVLPSSDLFNRPWQWTLMTRHTYRLETDLAGWGYLRLRLLRKYFSDGETPRSVTVAVPSSAGFIASSCDLGVAQMGVNCAGKSPLPQVNSLAELNASSRPAYFRNGPDIVLKLFTNRDSSVLLERQ